VTTNSGVPGAEPHDDLGTIAESGRRSVRRISSAVTTRDIATRLAAIPDTNSDTRDTLARVQSALTAFTSAQYARTPSLDRGPLDQALSDAIASARRIRSRQASPVIQIRRWFGQRVDVA
jgi:ribosomal 50S subunit-associated protein YjgA (DUF615 family)